MSNFTSVNILDMINAIGEEELQPILSDFSCPKNHEIEGFVRKNAIEFAKRKMSVTYLVVDGESRIVGIFTLTHKAVKLLDTGLTGTMRRKSSVMPVWTRQRTHTCYPLFWLPSLGRIISMRNQSSHRK